MVNMNPFHTKSAPSCWTACPTNNGMQSIGRKIKKKHSWCDKETSSVVWAGISQHMYIAISVICCFKMPTFGLFLGSLPGIVNILMQQFVTEYYILCQQVLLSFLYYPSFLLFKHLLKQYYSYIIVVK